MKFSVPNMSCGHCVASIEKAVTVADPAAWVECDLDSRTVDIDSVLDVAQVQATLDKAGFPATMA